jgi:hypothetical protein
LGGGDGAHEEEIPAKGGAVPARDGDAALVIRLLVHLAGGRKRGHEQATTEKKKRRERREKREEY